MPRVIDLECYAPGELSDPAYHAIERGRPGTPFPDPLERPAGYGFANYEQVFTGPSVPRRPDEAPPDDGGMKQLAADMDPEQIIIVNLSGRGDKDIHTVAARDGITV